VRRQHGVEFPVFIAPAVEAIACFSAEQVRAATERRLLQHQLIELIGFPAVFAGDAVEEGREWQMPRATDRAQKDRFVHRPHAISSPHARLAAGIALQPDDLRDRIEAPSPRDLLRLAGCYGPARRPQQQQTIAARQLVHPQRFDGIERHDIVMRVGAFLRPGVRIIDEIPRRIGDDRVVAKHLQRPELPI
jgi:hypothetical protein